MKVSKKVLDKILKTMHNSHKTSIGKETVENVMNANDRVKAVFIKANIKSNKNV